MPPNEANTTNAWQLGMIAIYVDDFLCSGTNDFETNFISKLQICLWLEWEAIYFSILRYKFDRKWFNIDVENLKSINYICNKTDTKDLLQSHIGKLFWIGSETRPDIAFHVWQFRNFKNSGEQDVKYTHKVMRHLKQDPAQIIYKQLGIDENLKLVAYVMDLMETYQMEEVN